MPKSDLIMNSIGVLAVCLALVCSFVGTLSAKTKATTNGQNYVSQSKSNWVYQRSPRVGSLFIRTGGDRALYPGALNCARNRITLEEFKTDLSVSLPSAKSDFAYTIVIYKDNFLAAAIGNIKGEDLYEGRMSGYEVAELSGVEESDEEQIFFVEVLEQETGKTVPEQAYDRDDWTSILSGWRGDVVSGSAGKTCLVIAPKDSQTPTDDANDITQLFQQFIARESRS